MSRRDFDDEVEQALKKIIDTELELSALYSTVWKLTGSDYFNRLSNIYWEKADVTMTLLKHWNGGYEFNRD